MSLHISWTPPSQPATRYFVDLDLQRGFRRMWFRSSPHKLAWCHKCRRRRRLKNLRIIAQAYYDPMVFCAGGCAPKKRRAPRGRAYRQGERQ